MSSPGEREPAPTALPTATITLQEQQTEKPLQKFHKGEPLALGVTLIMLGMIQFTFGFPLRITKLSEVTGMGVPWWLAALLTISGSLSVHCDRHPNKPRVTACLATNIINAIATIVGILTYCADFLVTNHRFNEFQQENANFKVFHMGVKVVLLVFTIVGLVLNITLAVYCCKGLRYCSASSRMPVVVVHGPRSETPAGGSPLPTA